MATLHATPVPGIPLLPPTEIPAPDAKLKGYLVIDPSQEDKIWHKPDPAKMNARGWAGVIAGALLFWPVTCVPCFLSCSYSRYQIPVYE